MMPNSPRTSAPMLMRGNALVLKKTCRKCPENQSRNTCLGPRTSLPQRAFHPSTFKKHTLPVGAVCSSGGLWRAGDQTAG